MRRDNGDTLTIDFLDQLLEPTYPKMLEIFRKNIANQTMHQDVIIDYDNTQFYIVFDASEKRQEFNTEFLSWIDGAASILETNDISIETEFIEIQDISSSGQTETIPLE